MKSIGVTGTRNGLSNEQLQALTTLLAGIREDWIITEVHHGDCVGVDEQFATICDLIFEDAAIHAHPCNIFTYRANHGSDVIHEVCKPLDRNKNIVNAVDFMLAFPAESHEVRRSGTWATIRYALKIGRKIVVVYPDGSISYNKI